MDVDALNLVKLVKARPAIYITKKQGDKAKLWQEIAAEMNWSGKKILVFFLSNE